LPKQNIFISLPGKTRKRIVGFGENGAIFAAGARVLVCPG
jgi:hypothetical protein